MVVDGGRGLCVQPRKSNQWMRRRAQLWAGTVNLGVLDMKRFENHWSKSSNQVKRYKIDRTSRYSYSCSENETQGATVGVRVKNQSKDQ